MSTDFGRRLQSTRREHGLSQVALGQDAYSASYVSLIESGRRAPTPAFIRHAAAVLGLDPQDVARWAETTDDRLVEVTELTLQSTARAEDGELVAAAGIARRAAALARDAGEPATHWSLVHRAAQLLRRAGRAEEALPLHRELLDHEVTTESPELTADVCVALGWDCLVLDRLAEAGAMAERAARQPLEDNPALAAEIIRLQTALAAEREDFTAALDLVERHAALLDDERLTAQHRGKLAWAFGNAAYVGGRAEEGADLHARASVLLSPERDLPTWSRFIRASAHMRLRAGIVDEVTEALMRDAETVARLLGSDDGGHSTDEIRARHAALTAEPDVALPLIADVIERHAAEMGGVMTAELHQLAADLSAAAGREADVVRHSAAAAKLYSDAGLPERASAALERLLD